MARDFIMYWPDFTEMPFEERERRLLDMTVETLALRDPDGHIEDLLTTKPSSPELTPNDRIFADEFEETLVNTIALALRPPKKREAGSPRRDLDKAVAALDNIIRGEDEALRQKLLARLRQKRRPSTRRTTYDRMVLTVLKHLAEYAQAEWSQGGLKRWTNMPTAADFAVDYFLRVRGHSDKHKYRQRLTKLLENYMKNPR